MAEGETGDIGSGGYSGRYKGKEDEKGRGGDRDYGDRDVATGPIPFVEGGGADICVVLGEMAGEGFHVAGSGTDTQGSRGIPNHNPGGGGDGNSQFPPRHLHCLQ